jgi:hypothetical protein
LEEEDKEKEIISDKKEIEDLAKQEQIDENIHKYMSED